MKKVRFKETKWLTQVTEAVGGKAGIITHTGWSDSKACAISEGKEGRITDKNAKWRSVLPVLGEIFPL